MREIRHAIRIKISLRSNRFRLISEQKETVEGDFRFWSTLDGVAYQRKEK